jgi:hypothetical protein
LFLCTIFTLNEKLASGRAVGCIFHEGDIVRGIGGDAYEAVFGGVCVFIVLSEAVELFWFDIDVADGRSEIAFKSLAQFSEFIV